MPDRIAPAPLSHLIADTPETPRILKTIGVISDTHALLRPEALAALAPSDHILHAGDIGNIKVLDALRHLAPVTAIRGNIDTDGPCTRFPTTELVEFAGRLFYLVHSITDLDISPAAAGVAAVISGHSHRPSQETRNGVLYLNPGSAGPMRFSLPVTIALVTITPTALESRIVHLL